MDRNIKAYRRYCHSRLLSGFVLRSFSSDASFLYRKQMILPLSDWLRHIKCMKTVARHRHTGLLNHRLARNTYASDVCGASVCACDRQKLRHLNSKRPMRFIFLSNPRVAKYPGDRRPHVYLRRYLCCWSPRTVSKSVNRG